MFTSGIVACILHAVLVKAKLQLGLVPCSRFSLRRILTTSTEIGWLESPFTILCSCGETRCPDGAYCCSVCPYHWKWIAWNFCAQFAPSVPMVLGCRKKTFYQTFCSLTKRSRIWPHRCPRYWPCYRPVQQVQYYGNGEQVDLVYRPHTNHAETFTDHSFWYLLVTRIIFCYVDRVKSRKQQRPFDSLEMKGLHVGCNCVRRKPFVSCRSEVAIVTVIVTKLICRYVVSTWSVKAVGTWSVNQIGLFIITHSDFCTDNIPTRSICSLLITLWRHSERG